MTRSLLWRAGVPILIGGVLALLPSPSGLSQNAWFFLALFVAQIAALVLEPVPPAATGLISVTLAALLTLVDPSPAGSIQWALSGFANSTVWLIFAAYVFAMGYEQTGLGRRIALELVGRLGRKTLGLGYAVALADPVLAPLMPSNTARSGGTIFPIIRNIPALYGSEPGETSRRIGSYLMWTALAATCVTSSMFLTGMAPNLLAVDLVRKSGLQEISWADWLAGFLPAGSILLASVPILVYRFYPPEIKNSEEVPPWAVRELARMGPITRNEVTMSIFALLALVLWIFGASFVDATTVALMVIVMMLMTGITTWEQILANRAAWNVLAWFATLVTLAGGLTRVGFTDWFGARTTAIFQGLTPGVSLIALVTVFFLTHYMFASITAHTTALLPVFLAAGAAVPGMDVRALALLLSYSLGIMGILTPYATGPSPVYFGSGFIPRRDFWILGVIFGAIYLAVFLAVTAPYLTAIRS